MISRHLCASHDMQITWLIMWLKTENAPSLVTALQTKQTVSTNVILHLDKLTLNLLKKNAIMYVTINHVNDSIGELIWSQNLIRKVPNQFILSR